MIKEGATAPAFNTTDANGETVSLKDLRGQKVVLYFYPKDDTPGCTQEALSFTEKAKAFAAAKTANVGVSRDSVAKHDKFAAKHGLELTLASDEDGEVCNRYGVWVEKTLYGRKFMGVERATFLIDSKGRIEHVWRRVRVPGHVEEVLKMVKAQSAK